MTRTKAMRSLRPITVLLVGPALAGLAQAVVFAVNLPEQRSLISVLTEFAIGAAFSLVVFGPISAGIVLGAKRYRWLSRYSFRIEWYVSLLMAASMGYLVASARHHRSDGITVVAFMIVGVGATIKVMLSMALSGDSEAPPRLGGGQRPSNPPQCGGGGGRPPLQPVANPSSGQPPALSAAAIVNREQA